MSFTIFLLSTQHNPGMSPSGQVLFSAALMSELKALSLVHAAPHTTLLLMS